jgi:hypothetical protein
LVVYFFCLSLLRYLEVTRFKAFSDVVFFYTQFSAKKNRLPISDSYQSVRLSNVTSKEQRKAVFLYFKNFIYGSNNETHQKHEQ